MTYSKRYAGGFVDSPSTVSPIDSTFLNAVETALVALFGATPATNGALIWNGSSFSAANLIANAQIDPAAAIAKTKLAALNIGNSDVAGAAAIARSKLDFGSGLVNADIATAAAIASSKLADPVVRALYRKTAIKTVNTTVAATDLLNGEITIPTGILTGTSAIRLSAAGDMLQNSGVATVAQRFQLSWGGATILDTGTLGAGAFGNSASRLSWTLDVLVQNQSTTQLSCRMNLIIYSASGASNTSSAFSVGTGQYWQQGTLAIATGININSISTTGSIPIVLNVINPSASASCETRLNSALVEVS